MPSGLRWVASDMGWIKKVPPPHVCSVPWVVPTGVGRGSVWECSCGRQYELVSATRGYFGDPYPTWEELIP